MNILKAQTRSIRSYLLSKPVEPDRTYFQDYVNYGF